LRRLGRSEYKAEVIVSEWPLFGGADWWSRAKSAVDLAALTIEN